MVRLRAGHGAGYHELAEESLRGALSGTSGGKIKQAKMACAFGCDKACGCDCCGKPASG
jgi:hypothetical protein